MKESKPARFYKDQELENPETIINEQKDRKNRPIVDSPQKPDMDDEDELKKLEEADQKQRAKKGAGMGNIKKLKFRKFTKEGPPIAVVPPGELEQLPDESTLNAEDQIIEKIDENLSAEQENEKDIGLLLIDIIKGLEKIKNEEGEKLRPEQVIPDFENLPESLKGIIRYYASPGLLKSLTFKGWQQLKDLVRRDIEKYYFEGK